MNPTPAPHLPATRPGPDAQGAASGLGSAPAPDKANSRLPLGHRVSLVLVLVALLFALVLQIVGLMLTRRHLESAHRQHASAVAKIVAIKAEEAVLTGTHYRLPPLLKSVASANPDLGYIALCRSDGSVIAYECGGGLSRDLAAALKAEGLPGAPRLLNLQSDRGQILHVVQPLEEGRVGYLHLGFAWAPVDAALRQTCLNLLVAMVAGLLVCGLIAWFAYQRLVGPITLLVRAARDFGEGRLNTRVPDRPGARDETVLLGRAFNQMATKLEEHVSDLERSRAELTDEKMRVQAIVDSMVQSVIVAAPDGRIIYCNQAAITLWLPEGSPPPRRYAQIHAARPDVMRAFEAVAQSLSARQKVNCRLGERELVVLISPALGDHRESLGVIEITTDVTEQILSERALAHAEKLHVVGQLAAGVAHEINSPLDGAIEASGIMERNSNDAEKVLRFAKAQRGALERIAAIVRTLLTFSRRPKTREQREVSISKVLSEAQAILKHRLTKKRITLEMPTLNLDATVQGDELTLVQVLVNLINNALDVTPEGGTIQISVESAAAQLRISVTDQGPGIPSEVAPRLFTPFFTTKDVGQGTGLGLATSRNIVEEHGGRIEFCNLTSPWGARFTVHLPCHQPDTLNRSRADGRAPVHSETART